MPKKIITKATLPKIMRELDRWDGKLTWPLFCERAAKVLDVPSISKHTMYLYPAVKERFQQRQKDLREARDALPRDFTLDAAIRRITDLEAQVKRLGDTNNLLLDQFRRWQYNAYANNVRMDLLALDKPLPEVNRSGRRKGEKKKRENSEQ
ncbi:hypothetical protein I5U05_010120 [Stenotrophomonas maltophilia]|jgi:hypothetical protein|uniref:hypothetical protein n=1 Tax=Stenotrophomonas TaxID=40323 RepID=UPI0013105AD5|nr:MULTISPECIES: hypothetical protein [Stenotrophomonas]MBH1609383.1 hypothetical protein [Stenotrophomonas maltophilia]MBH1725217.1 hypothetical protein [Stenotrophomonas maltophilia]MBH1798054.1 hypothetical protein [Stenotrophomonas maltophilia]MBH1805303.1 hypothetical protein [Stenotrophomonas maltophilia]MCU1125952.1 hypothetical protein [Stenotrophomonas maltophilia]